MTNTQAKTDALASARAHLAEERRAVETCKANGYTTDLAFAESEVKHYRALVARLESQQ